MKKGIDVSKHQNAINWKQVKSDNIDFAIIRTGYWTDYVDPMWEKNYGEAKSVDIKVGAYHYSYSLSVGDAEKEANFVINLLKGKTLDYPIAFDIEDPKQLSLGKKLLTDICIAFCDTVKKAGYRPMLYINTNWRNNLLDMTRLIDYPLWQAHYPLRDVSDWSKLQNARPKAIDDKVSIWQCTPHGLIKGISTPVDLNFDFTDMAKTTPVPVPNPIPPQASENALGYVASLISTNNMRISNGGGYRIPSRPNHNGMDFTDAQRFELKQDIGILAFADGIVTDTTVGSLIGVSCSILHDNGLLTRYFHMKSGSVKVKVGDRVKKGQQIGVMGTTGDSTGIHLHFETKENSSGGIGGTWVNPELYLLGQKTVSASPNVTVPTHPSTNLKVNDKVKVKQGAKTYTEGNLASFVYTRTHKVYQINGDRAVISFNGEVTAAVNVKDLQKV